MQRRILTVSNMNFLSSYLLKNINVFSPQVRNKCYLYSNICRCEKNQLDLLLFIFFVSFKKPINQASSTLMIKRMEKG